MNVRINVCTYVCMNECMYVCMYDIVSMAYSFYTVFCYTKLSVRILYVMYYTPLTENKSLCVCGVCWDQFVHNYMSFLLVIHVFYYSHCTCGHE